MAIATEPIPTLADLLTQARGHPPRRVLLRPFPGTATEQDVADVGTHQKRLCELIDGVLVEKAVGFQESQLAILLAYFLVGFVRQHDLGIVAGADGPLRLRPGQVRIPDLCFIAWDRLPGRQLPRDPIPNLVPDLAVEVSAGNTPAEMGARSPTILPRESAWSGSSTR